MSTDEHLLRRHSSPVVYFIFRIVFQKNTKCLMNSLNNGKRTKHNFSKNLSSGCNRVKTGNINLIFLVQMSFCTSFTFVCHDDSAERLVFMARHV